MADQVPTGESSNARQIELLANDVADKALAKIQTRLKWPLLLVAAFAAYTGYNVWSDVTKRIEAFYKSADEKLTEIDKKADERLDKAFQRVLDARKGDITELTNQLRKESASALIEAERARLASSDSSEKIKRQADGAIAQVNRQATETISALEGRLREVSERGASVLHAMAMVEVSI